MGLHAADSDSTDPASATSSNDPFLWLENTHGDRALDWVNQQDEQTRDTDFASGEDFQHLQQQLLEVLNSDESIPGVHKMGDYYYNFWKDADHPRGIWRRTTLDEYKTDDTDWETVLDVDKLGKKEGHEWVWKGAQCLQPDYQRCLISLSPHGGDAVVVREFDIPDKSFVEDGFRLSEAKTDVDWIDKSHIYVGTDFGEGSMTESSYPRIGKKWTRGTPLEDAETVIEGDKDDLTVTAFRDNTPGYERDFVAVVSDFFHSELYQLVDGEKKHIDVPADAEPDVHRDRLLVELKSDWDVNDTTYAAGSLLVINYADFMDGDRDFDVLFKPNQHTALSDYSWTRHHLIVNVMDDVNSELTVFTPQDDGSWQQSPLPGVPSNSTVSAYAVDPDHSDAYWLNVTGFLTPTKLKLGTIGDGKAETLKQDPDFFATSDYNVSQHFATSKDGTRIPYFEVAPKDMDLDGSNRTLLYGYGGFGISLQPSYSGRIGRGWLERGGVYVVANIRGGGEYGPRWHHAAMRENRPKAYQDFAAVARDLVDRGVTSPEHLGAQGGSNGGLLMGNMLTEYPDLFGAIACNIPLLDMKRYIHLAAGSSWIAEYGNPDDPEQWKFIKTFSPYQNVKADRDYPPILFYTSTSDDRVGPEQARKMAARMEKQGHDKVWFYENREGGHGAGADAKQSAFMFAMDYNFLWHKLK